MIRNIFDKFSKTNTSKQFMINKIIVCIAELDHSFLKELALAQFVLYGIRI